MLKFIQVKSKFVFLNNVIQIVAVVKLITKNYKK